MKNRRSILPVIGLGVLATILTLVFLAWARSETQIVVAARPINVGARLTENDLTLKAVRASDVPEGALTTIEEAVGQSIGVQRTPGDPVTMTMLGNQAVSAIAGGLAPDKRAMAINVNRASGIAGLLRPGDFVSLIAIINPPQDQALAQLPGLNGADGSAAGVPVSSVVTTGATSLDQSIVPWTTFARVTATGLKVLLVPQTFRYNEVTETDAQGFAQAQSSEVGQQESVVALEVPVTPVSIKGPNGTTIEVSLPELIALLDTEADLYLALEPAANAEQPAHFPGVAIEQIVDAGVGGN